MRKTTDIRVMRKTVEEYKNSNRDLLPLAVEYWNELASGYYLENSILSYYENTIGSCYKNDENDFIVTSIDDIISEVIYWLSCYYEDGNTRKEDEFNDRKAFIKFLSVFIPLSENNFLSEFKKWRIPCNNDTMELYNYMKKSVDNAVIVDNVSTEKNIDNVENSARGCDMKKSIVVEKTSNKSMEWDNNFYNMLSDMMKNSRMVTFYPHKNSKDFSRMRNSLVVDTSLERVIENNSVELIRELNKREFPIYNYMSELVTKGLLNVGYQFGIKRFNTMFIKWDNGKATAKSNVIPTATDINNACKHFYKYNAEKVGFMPIVRMNNDGAIIIDCVSYIPNFYSEKVEKKSTVSRDKILDKIGKSINDLNSLIRENVTSGILTSDDVTSIIKALETIGKNSEVKIDIANIA